MQLQLSIYSFFIQKEIETTIVINQNHMTVSTSTGRAVSSTGTSGAERTAAGQTDGKHRPKQKMDPVSSKGRNQLFVYILSQ